MLSCYTTTFFQKRRWTLSDLLATKTDYSALSSRSHTWTSAFDNKDGNRRYGCYKRFPRQLKRKRSKLYFRSSCSWGYASCQCVHWQDYCPPDLYWLHCKICKSAKCWSNLMRISQRFDWNHPPVDWSVPFCSLKSLLICGPPNSELCSALLM